MHLFCTETVSFPTAGLFSRSRLRGTQGAACTLGVSLDPGRAPWRVLWAFKVAGSGKYPRDHISPRPASQDNGNPTIKIFAPLLLLILYHICITPSLKLSSSTLWQPRYNSSRTVSSSCCDVHGRCICVCVCPMCHVFCRPGK